MQLKAIILLSLYTLQINAAAIDKRSDQILASVSASASSPSIAQKSPMSAIDYNANKNYVPYQRLNNDMTLADDDDIFDMDDDDEQDEMTSEDYTRPHHSLDQDAEESPLSTNMKYGVTHVGSRQHRYRDSTSAYNPDPMLVVPMKQATDDIESSSKPLPRRKQKSLIGVDDHGHVRHVVLDSNKDEKEDVRRLGQKNVVAFDDQGEQHTMVLPMTMLPGGRS
ncbi:unnamed protein product [Absidia cylindrospora]